MATKNKDVQKIKNDIKKLPSQMSSNEIVRMYCELKKDIVDFKNRGNMSPKQIEQVLHNKHKTLALSYPTVFFKTVRGEMDNNMFFYMMSLKKKVDEGQISNEEAKNYVIDGIKKSIEKNGPTPKKKQQPGQTVTEFSAMVKPED